MNFGDSNDYVFDDGFDENNLDDYDLDFWFNDLGKFQWLHLKKNIFENLQKTSILLF